MPIIKDYKKAMKKMKDISSRFNLSKCKKEHLTVEKIVNDVRLKGDKAIVEFTKRFDGVKLNQFKISSSEINNSTKHISGTLLQTIKKAINRITVFHKTNVPKSWTKTYSLNEKMGYKYEPLESVGIYIPGGKTPLISTLLMTVIPAKVAGVKRVAVFSPPLIHKGILAACKLVGVKEVYSVGGAQAIAAATYGTKSIKPVNKIVGPGNIYVTLAKKIVFGTVGIDGLYGPSEIAVLADKTAHPEYIAMDLLSQLEHGSGLESAVLITDSREIAKNVERNVLKLSKSLPNSKTVLKSWKRNSAIILVSNLQIGIKLINQLAPEHLEVVTSNPQRIVPYIKNAGAIFLGKYSCESLGDYMAGPSHCLPTGGSAKFSSGLTVGDFLKKSSLISFDRQAFNRIAQDVIRFADAENLKAHSDAVKIRLQNNKGKQT